MSLVNRFSFPLVVSRWCDQYELRVRFLGESKNGFMISGHKDSSLLQKGRSDKGSFAMTTSRSCVPRVEKNRRNIYKSKLILGAKRRRKSNVNYT